jgi:hypothetical protein
MSHIIDVVVWKVGRDRGEMKSTIPLLSIIQKEAMIFAMSHFFNIYMTERMFDENQAAQ